MIRCPAFKKLTHQPDAPARAVTLITCHHIGRTGGSAEPAMHAFAKNGVSLANMRVKKLDIAEIRLHTALVYTP